MLLLSRRVGESIELPNCGATVTVLQVHGSQVRIGISAPREVSIVRIRTSVRTCELESVQQSLIPSARNEGYQAVKEKCAPDVE